MLGARTVTGVTQIRTGESQRLFLLSFLGVFRFHCLNVLIGSAIFADKFEMIHKNSDISITKTKKNTLMP